MSSVICRIYPSPSSRQALLISKRLLAEWNCPSSQSIKLSLGNKTLTTRIHAINRREPTIYIPRSIAYQLYLPHFGEIRVSYEEKELRMGPLIAILTTGFTGIMDQPFANRTQLYRNFIMAGHEEKPFFYIFTPEMVDWREQVVSGLFYLKDSDGRYRWCRLTTPLPDVIYERIPNRKSESLPQVQVCCARLKKTSRTQIFNQGFFNKWSIHEKLYGHTMTLENIPETHYAPNTSIIRDMLERHHMVYLKPSGGSLGLGIFRITQHPDGGYYYRFRDGNRNILRHFQTIDSLLKHHFHGQMRPLKSHVIQQGIRLIKYQGRPVDFRVHMHKDKTDRWKVVCIGAKVAGAGSVTTHGRTGGTILSSSELFRATFPDQEKEMKQKIIDASIRIATALEGEVQGPLGELGLDIGVDRYQKVWLFEVNSKPGRHIFVHPALKDAGKLSARCITEYSLKLAQFF